MDLREALIYAISIFDETLKEYDRYDPLPEMVRDDIEALLEETLKEVDLIRTTGKPLPDEVLVRRSYDKCRRRSKDGKTLVASEGKGAVRELITYLRIALRYLGVTIIVSSLSGKGYKFDVSRRDQRASKMLEPSAANEQAPTDDS